VTRAGFVRVCDQILHFTAPTDILDHLVSFLVLTFDPPHPGRAARIGPVSVESFHYFAAFPHHFRVDVLDTSHHWVAALVMEREKRSDGWWVYICFDGWSPRWSEWLPWDTQIIQPHKTFSCHSGHRQLIRYKYGVEHENRHKSCLYCERRGLVNLFPNAVETNTDGSILL